MQMTAAFGLAVAFTLALGASANSAFGQVSPTPDRRVALTFDDLPMTGGPPCDSRLAREVTAKRVYAAVYQHAKTHADDAMLERLVDAYLVHLAASMEFYERLSIEVFGREIPQVLLLHANHLNADHIVAVTSMLEKRGYRFVSLAEAVSDTAYARPDTYVGRRGLSWIQRWALEAGVPIPDEPREHAWVAEALQRIRAGGM